MRLELALALALALPACATASSTGDKGDEEWDSRSPTGKTEYWRKGGYASVGALQGFEHFSNLPSGSTGGDSDLGFAIRGGWRLDRDVAVELTVENATGYTVKGGGFDSTIDFWSYGIQGKYYFADQKFQPYGLVGLGGAHATITNGAGSLSGGLIRIGVGTEYYLKKDVALFGEVSYNRLTGDLKHLDHVDLILGVLVRF
jgi:opacity protein-like surface antigen